MSPAAFSLFLILCSAVVVFPAQAERVGERVLRALHRLDAPDAGTVGRRWR